MRILKVYQRKIVWLRVILCVVGFFYLCVTGIAHSASDDFTIRTLVGNDTTPPSTPTNVTAIPVAISQINLSWASSTDNFLVSGYQVWRDDVQIATTTTLFYYDTGLVASTTYTYAISAFDSFNNFSTSSTPIATTTLQIPISISTSTASTSASSLGRIVGSMMHPLADEILSLEILPQRESVVIRYTTASMIRSVVKWGRSTSYELGSLAENIYNTRHETKIAGLEPGTRYQFTIDGENKFGRYGTMHTGTFVTLEPEDVFPPGNVTNLHATRDGDAVILSWENPVDEDFSKIRVVRSDQFYPNNVLDGWVVYEGTGMSVRDAGTPSTGRLYYTIFSYDALGNVSSGAVLSISSGDDSATSEEHIVDPLKNEIALQFNEIQFGQEGVPVVAEDGTVMIDGTKQLTIAIPYNRLPEHLKTILVTIRDSQQSARSFNFLLRVNKEKTAYVSTVAPFGTSGDFPITVSVFDYKTSQIGYTDGTLVSRIKIHSETETLGIVGFIKNIQRIYILLLIIFIVGLMYIGRRVLRTEF